MDSIRTLFTMIKLAIMCTLFVAFACWAESAGASGNVQAIGLFVFLTFLFSAGGSKKKRK